MGNSNSRRRERHNEFVLINPPSTSIPSNSYSNSNSYIPPPSNSYPGNNSSIPLPSNSYPGNNSYILPQTNSYPVYPSNSIQNYHQVNNSLPVILANQLPLFPEKQIEIEKENILESLLPGFAFEYTNECTFITETACCICFHDYYDGMIMQMLPCNHVIHKECLSDWYRKSTTCPLCRSDSGIPDKI